VLKQADKQQNVKLQESKDTQHGNSEMAQENQELYPSQNSQPKLDAKSK
jgi:hypothetical protein